jgi:hypothetical protein
MVETDPSERSSEETAAAERTEKATRMEKAAPAKGKPGSDWSVYVVLTLVIQGLLGVGFVLFVLRGDWENVFLTALVIVLTLLPTVLDRQYRFVIPPEFQFFAAAFVYLSLYLGSAGDFYYHFWWWDLVLHTGAGFLLGIIGFVALFLLNQTDRLPQGIKPGFICFFAVTFAVFLGVVWEIFEYLMDQVAPYLNMQSAETGVDDTMHDLIVDLLGAVAVAAMGWGYMKTGRYSFIADAVRGFVNKNPRLFRRPRGPRGLRAKLRGGLRHVRLRRKKRRSDDAPV